MKTILITSSIAALALASNAAAQPRYASFGDNIADPGSIPGILAAANAAGEGPFDTNFPASPPGFGNRYSNGLTAAELLSILLGIDASNTDHRAVGNAFSGKLPVSLAGNILLGNGSSIPGPIGRGLTPLNDTDIASQIDVYLSDTGPLRAEDIMLLYPSGNDGALALNTIALTLPSQAEALSIVISGAATNAANTAASAFKLLEAGAGTVLVSNLPNIGQTPAAQAGALSGQQLATLFSTETNAQLVAQLSTLDSGKSTLLIADSFTLTNDIVANPEKYGFSDVRSPCSLVPSCVAADRSVQDQFLFWDPFFPTARGHEISAAFLADTIAAPKTLSALSEQGRMGIEDTSRDLLAPVSAEGGFLTGDIKLGKSERDAAPQAIGNETDSIRYDIALGHAGQSHVAGISIGYTDAETRFDTINAGFDRSSYSVGMFAQKQLGKTVLSGAMSYSIDQYDDIYRVTGVANQTARSETDGNSFSAIGQIALPIAWSEKSTITPRVRLGYAQSDIEQYTETGATGLTQAVADFDSSQTFAEVGTTIERQFGWGGGTARAHLAADYHVALNDSEQTIATALVTVPDFTRVTYVDAPDESYGRIGLGLSGNPRPGMTLEAKAQTTIGSDDFDAYWGSLNFKIDLK